MTKPRVKKRGRLWEVSYGDLYGPDPYGYISMTVGSFEEAIELANRAATSKYPQNAFWATYIYRATRV